MIPAEPARIRQDLQGHYAGCFTRLFAFIIDQIIMGLILVLISWTTRITLLSVGLDLKACQTSSWTVIRDICQVAEVTLTVINFSFAPIYLFLLWWLTGQTIGKYLVGVRVVRADGKGVTIFTALRRLIGYIVSILTLGLGFLWIAFDDRRQGWHDKIANTCVIYAWDARQDEYFLGRAEGLIRRWRRTVQVLEMVDSIKPGKAKTPQEPPD